MGLNMVNFTVRNIPDNIMEKLRALSEEELRSVNNEILVVLERGLRMSDIQKGKNLSKELKQSIINDIIGAVLDNNGTI